MNRIRSSVFSLLLLVLVSASAFAQNRRITGRITVEGSGEPVAAASVSVVGTALGAYTDDQGRFSIAAPEGPVTLRVRRIGYIQKSVPIPAGATESNVGLARDILQLETQVVTGTATTVSSVNAANAVTVVSGEKLNKVPAQTIDYALQGKVPGAIITQNSGAPGGGVQIQLRGVSTINASFQPLYVIDGVIVDNSQIANGINAITAAGGGNFGSTQDQRVNRTADLNPNDIENIQVLKGPSASSIYGSRGTNGVIVITTKQGQAGQTTLDLTQRFGTAALSNTIGIRCFGSGQEYANWTGDTAVTKVAADIALYNAATNKCNDYQQQLYGQHPFNYQTIASLRGATAGGTNFYLSGLVQHDGGLVLNDNYNKQSIRVNVGQKFGGRLQLRANSEIIHSLTERGISGNDNTGINPYTNFSQTPSFINLQQQPDGSFPKGLAVNNTSNPFQNAVLIKTPEDVFRMLGSASAIYDFISTDRQKLDFTLSGGLDSYSDHAKVISPATAYVEQVNANPGTIVLGDANILNATLGAVLRHQFSANAFTATTSAGFGQVRRNADIVENTGRGVFPGVTNVSTATQIFTTESQDLVKSSSFFGQEEFLTMSERLFLTAGVTAERTSNNGDPQKYYAYPKFSGSYRLPFLPPKTDELKLRLAYGRAGNQPLSGKYTFLTNIIDDGRTGYRASTAVGLPGIKPETTSEIEGGLDWTLFSGRTRLSATQFRKQTDDLILSASLAPSTGFTSQTVNGGQLVTHGTELELNMTPIRTAGGFEWISGTTYSSNKGKVTQLPVPGFIPASGSFGSRFGNAFIQQGQLITVVQAVNGCTALNAAGTSCPSANRVLTFVGNAAPDYEMGFSNDLNFGSFHFSSLVDWRKGGLGVNLTNDYFVGAGTLADTARARAMLSAFAKGTDVWLENSGFVKIREMTLGYDLPSSMSSRLFQGHAQNARIEISGRNLKTWTKYTGLDPEVSNFGNQPLGRFQDVTPYPPSRQWYLTVNTTF
jgi:TonB-dependent starch-binding outer membrane protein SusC